MPGFSRLLGVYLLIALVQGLVFCFGEQIARQGEALLFAAIALILVGGTSLQLLGKKLFEPKVLLLTLASTLFMTGMTAWLFSESEHHGGKDWPQNLWLPCMVLLSYLSYCFVSAWPTAKGQRWRYETLFQQAWNSVFTGLFALLLTALFMALLKLWGYLFLMLGIEFFKVQFSSSVFYCFSLPLMFSLGMYLGLHNPKVIDQLRGLLLGGCRFLLPVIALISVLFTLTLPFSGLQQIWATGYSTPILLVLAGAHLFLLNGVFQDGRQPAAYPVWLLRFVELSLLCLPILAGLAAYSSWLRIEQYGMSPQRFIGLLLTLVAGLYGLAAVWAVALRSSSWLNSLRLTNTVLALVCYGVLVLINTPLLNPQKLSAQDQVRRVLDGRIKAEAFDARHLRFDLGEPGNDAYLALKDDLEQGRIGDADLRRVLRTRIELADMSFSESLEAERAARPAPKLEWLGPTPPGSEQFVKISLEYDSPCERAGCALWAVDLDLDGQQEVLLMSLEEDGMKEEQPRIYKRWKDGEWLDMGVLMWAHMPSYADVKTLIRDIRQGTIKVTRPRYQQLESSDMQLVPLMRQ